MDEPRPLTAKQRSFALLVASGTTAQAAYNRVYSNTCKPDTARAEGGKISRRPAVRALIDQLRNETAATLAKSMKDDLQLDRTYVLSNLKEVVERCMEAAPVKGRDGKPVPGQFTFDAKGANQALMLIGKELGMFIERREVRHGPLVDASDEDIEREIATIASELATLTGKPLRQVLLESVKMELAIDVTPSTERNIALPGAANDDDDATTGGGASIARGGP